ncbi:MAG: P-loop NTPase [Sphaerochaetaceae bacterium]|jgi:ATP-binding protein involved in chromosome partitioning
MEAHEQREVKEVLRNFGPLRDADAHARLIGACGDTVDFWLKGKDKVVTDSSYLSDGDDKSQQSASLLASYVIGKKIDELKDLHSKKDLTFLTTDQACSDHLKQVMEVAIGRLEVASITKAPRIEQVSEDVIPNKKKGRRTLMVMSGKGGVGKSTVAVNLAISLAKEGKRVGLVDVDIHGPSIPTMLNITNVTVMQAADGIQPIILGDLYQLEVMSVGFLLDNKDDPVVWRGPLKHSLIDQFLNQVAWGPLDYLIIDAPPGTGDEPLSVVQKLDHKAEAILVTTPQQVSSVDVARSINFCKQMGMDLVGIVENMSGFICPSCHTKTDIFRTGGGSSLAEEYNIPLLASIPIDASFGLAGDAGVPYVSRFTDSPSAEIYRDMVKKIEK